MFQSFFKERENSCFLRKKYLFTFNLIWNGKKIPSVNLKVFLLFFTITKIRIKKKTVQIFVEKNTFYMFEM